jgi:hypothetical protein
MLTRAPGLYLDRSALALNPSYAAQPNAQRRTSLDQMCVQCLPLLTAPASRSALALKEPGPWRVCRNYSREIPQDRLPRVSASAKLARSHPCQQAACFLPCTRPPDFVASNRSSTVPCTTSSFFSTSDVTPCLRVLAGRCAASLGFRATCIRRAESSGGLLATSFGGLQQFQGQHIFYG